MTGVLEFEFPLEKSSQSIVVIPYISGSGIRNKVAEPARDADFDAGLDMKLALSSSLNLDLTINPDFSQVEVDEQRTNLTRFELFLPEKREFFTDNGDLFSNLGSREARPMFTQEELELQEIQQLVSMFKIRYFLAPNYQEKLMMA